MKRCIDKKILILLLVLCLIFSLSLPVYAAFSWPTAISKVDTGEGVTELNNTASNVTGAILDTIRTVAVGISLIMLVVIAAKYMLAAPGDRADIKKHAIPYVIGAVILFASGNIVKIIYDFASKNVTGT